MTIGNTDFYEDSNSQGFQESADFVRDMENEDASGLNPQLRGLLSQDRAYAESAEAVELEEQHLSHVLQDEFSSNSDDDEEEEVNEMERLRDHLERSRNEVTDMISNFDHGELDVGDGEPLTENSDPLDMPVEDSPNHPLRVRQSNIIKKNEERLKKLFSGNAANENQPNGIATLNEKSLSITESLISRLIYLTEIAHEYLGGKLDLETPDTIFYAISLKRFLEEVCDQCILIFELFEEEAYKHLNSFNILYSNRDCCTTTYSCANRFTGTVRNNDKYGKKPI